jgi:hypothetical protein
MPDSRSKCLPPQITSSIPRLSMTAALGRLELQVEQFAEPVVDLCLQCRRQCAKFSPK